jgi:hypothetical protein
VENKSQNLGLKLKVKGLNMLIDLLTLVKKLQLMMINKRRKRRRNQAKQNNKIRMVSFPTSEVEEQEAKSRHQAQLFSCMIQSRIRF